MPRRAEDLVRADDAGFDEVFVGLGRHVEAMGSLWAYYLVNNDPALDEVTGPELCLGSSPGCEELQAFATGHI